MKFDTFELLVFCNYPVELTSLTTKPRPFNRAGFLFFCHTICMSANNSDFLRGQVHGDTTNQGVYNMGSALDARPFGTNDSQTESGSASAVGLNGAQSVKFEGEASAYKGNSSIGSKGFGG